MQCLSFDLTRNTMSGNCICKTIAATLLIFDCHVNWFGSPLRNLIITIYIISGNLMLSYLKKTRPFVGGGKRQPTSNNQQQQKCPRKSAVAIKDNDASIIRDLSNINSRNPRGVSAFDVNVNDVVMRRAQPKSAPSTNCIKKKKSKRKRSVFSIN